MIFGNKGWGTHWLIGCIAAACVTMSVWGAAPERIFIQEYRVKGAKHLTQLEIEEAVYPFLGPHRSQEDVEKARAALEQKYVSKGYQTVSVQIPSQPWVDGPILLEVTEMPVGQLRVNGSRYFLPSRIKELAPSLAPGTVINFNEVNRDVVALNQLADQRVTPSLRPGQTPGTVDISLEVQDTLPLHGSLELNNRRSENTTDLRLDGAVSYDNLWQLGHSIGGSFQLSPQDFNEVKVFSGYYLARFPEATWFNVMVRGTKQNSQVSTLGDLAVAGRGETVGLQTTFVLPGSRAYSQSLNLGWDYKRTDQEITLAGQTNNTVTSYYYFPFNVTYSATWVTTNGQTEINFGPTFSFRGLGSNPREFENSRYKSEGNFVYLRADVAHTHELPAGFQLYGKLSGQVADQPLVSAEQFGGGGLGTARGYLEGTVFGDNAIFGAVELRSPKLTQYWGDTSSDWRVYVFAEGGRLTLLDPLPEQKSVFDLASFGIGTRFRFRDHFNGSLDLGIPVISQSQTHASDLLLTFRVWIAL